MIVDIKMQLSLMKAEIYTWVSGLLKGKTYSEIEEEGIPITKENKNEFDKYFPVIPYRLYEKIENVGHGVIESCFISEQELKRMDQALEKSPHQGIILQEAADKNTIGINFEKAGNTEAAIHAYEENVYGEGASLHAYERLMILYHAHNKFRDELRIIERAIALHARIDFKDLDQRDKIDNWQHRKQRCLTKLNKKQK